MEVENGNIGTEDWPTIPTGDKIFPPFLSGGKTRETLKTPFIRDDFPTRAPDRKRTELMASSAEAPLNPRLYPGAPFQIGPLRPPLGYSRNHRDRPVSLVSNSSFSWRPPSHRYVLNGQPGRRIRARNLLPAPCGLPLSGLGRSAPGNCYTNCPSTSSSFPPPQGWAVRA